MTLGLDDGAVAFSSGATRRSADAVADLIGKARAEEEARYDAYGDLSEPKKMSQAGMMWNVIYSLEIPGTFAPVSRGWGKPWVIFDWVRRPACACVCLRACRVYFAARHHLFVIPALVAHKNVLPRGPAPAH